MLQKEFDERIGKESTAEEYRIANLVYMEMDSVDKDEFCAMYKRYAMQEKRESTKWSQLLFTIIDEQRKALEKQGADLYNALEEKGNLVAESVKIRIDTRMAFASGIMDICCNEQSGIYGNLVEEIESYVKDMIGEKEYLRFKLKSGSPLSGKDRELIDKLLGE